MSEDKDSNEVSDLEPDAEYLQSPPDEDVVRRKFNPGTDDELSKDTGFTENEIPREDGKPLEAVGISYDEDEAAPVVAAIGSEERAQAIIAMAKELGVYIHRDERLLNELKTLKEGEEVPKELYRIIATILSFSYLLQGRTPSGWKRPDGTVAVNTDA
ncbi:MAG: EscU/YscU/HrcU family type III secretion system export apparatus switch protein [Succinivibrio sp.]|jgi:type III secretion system FlhB-like substrate exporter|nr:EscU/YscU/HrcU family type III secretion system export apparatus switch protein [Succinivibrio sp.]